QSIHPVTLNSAPHFRQTACVSKVSKRFRHRLHSQNEPSGGADPHSGQAKPSRLGTLAALSSILPCIKPRQQLSKRKAHRMANQTDWAKMAPAIRAATPINPITVATIRLLPRPIKNQSSERRICPPSNG